MKKVKEHHDTLLEEYNTKKANQIAKLEAKINYLYDLEGEDINNYKSKVIWEPCIQQ